MLRPISLKPDRIAVVLPQRRSLRQDDTRRSLLAAGFNALPELAVVKGLDLAVFNL